VIGLSDFRLVAELQKVVPVFLTGGAAIQIYTEGAFRTRDIDLVTAKLEEATRELQRRGFVKMGHTWFREEDQKVIDLLWGHPERPRTVEFAGLSLRTVSLEYLVADRLAKCRRGLVLGCRQALELLDRYREGLDEKYLRGLLKRFDVDPSFLDERKLERLSGR
jgi:hypothetical protein